jgi:hypothetical protein
MKLQRLITALVPGSPLDSTDLAALGISADLAVHYVRAGWLQRLARGVYCRPGDQLALHPSVAFLQRAFPGLHVGGKSALDRHGIRQYVPARPTLHLYGWTAGRLPPWFTERFPAEYRRKRLFDEPPDALLSVRPFGDGERGPLVSEPERALLEVLSEVGVRQPLQEARELVESSYAMRADVLLELQLGRELSQPWAAKLDPSQLPRGSDRNWVSRSAEGLLVLKP